MRKKEIFVKNFDTHFPVVLCDSSTEGAARVCPTTEHPPSLNIHTVLHIAPIHPGGSCQAFQDV